MDLLAIVIALAALLLGLACGWWFGRSEAAGLRAALDQRHEEFRRAITELASAEERARGAADLAATLDRMRTERETMLGELATLRAQSDAFGERLAAQAEGFERQLAAQRAHQAEARETMIAQFRDLAGSALTEAQRQFLERADARFRQSEESTGKTLAAMLQPVNERLTRYETAVKQVETERASAFDQLKGQLEGLRTGQERVSAEAAKLVNALRNAPKARGRWGEQQLRNVLETCGLSEHADFQTEVSVTGDEGRLRPDVIIRIPGGRSLVVDAKVSLNAYQDAFEADDDVGRAAGLAAHAASMRAHMNALGNKAYQHQFKDTVDFVVMFVPGEHFVSAALEQDSTLWDDAFNKKVLIATPTNLVAVARTIASVWRQEKLARDAAEIGRLGKELYERLAVASQHLRVVGTGLTSAVNNYNKFVGSFERNVLSSGRRFLSLNIEPGAREIDEVSPVEVLPRYGEALPIEDQAAE